VRDVGFRLIANGRTACSGRLDKTWWDMPRCKFLIFHDGDEKPYELNLPLRVIETESGYSLEYSSKQNNLADDEWGWDCVVFSIFARSSNVIARIGGGTTVPHRPNSVLCFRTFGEQTERFGVFQRVGIPIPIVLFHDGNNKLFLFPSFDGKIGSFVVFV
ncbi:MAG: hypothetical protein FWG05_02470, partial [Kiritimatiellaeota bacterium]|nr:hypothetical protein [Kiritimatiellota bacterium]